MAIRNGYCDVGSGSLYFEVTGEGAPVLFIQGFGLNLRYWDDLLSCLPGGCRAIRYDRRGFGSSSEPRQDAPYSDFEDLCKLLDCVGVNEAHVVAGCVGCHVALEFALQYPGRVKALVLGNPDAGPGIAGVNEAFYKMVEDTRPFHAQGNLARALEVSFANPVVAPALRDDDVRFRLTRAMAGFRGWHFLHWYPRRTCDPPVSERLAEVKPPTLVVSGGKDYIYFRRTADRLSSSIPGATLEVLPDAGHFLFLEDPERAREPVGDFLKAH